MKAFVKLALAAAAAGALPVSGPAMAQVTGTEAAPAEEAVLAEDLILAVINAFMDGIADKDTEAMSDAALDTAFLAFVRPDEGGDAARTMPLSRAITSLAETVPDINEPLRDATVMVDGPVAMVWAPYDFYVDGERNHCGVNVFSLIRRDGDWRIASVVYSYLPDDCPPENAEEVTEGAEE